MEAHSYSAHKKTSSPKVAKKYPPLFLSPTNAVAPYILLKLLIQMRDEISAEVMESFTRDYLEMLEKDYPLLKESAADALKGVNIKKFCSNIKN